MKVSNRYIDGRSKERLYTIYKGMRNRCYRTSNNNYKNYGAKGVVMCDDWEKDYTTFRNWALSNGYEDNLTIDRIDNEKPYSPDNCRWVTYTRQARNKSTNRYLTFKAKTLCLADWAEIYNMNPNTLKTRLNNGWSVEDALLTPINIKFRKHKV